MQQVEQGCSVLLSGKAQPIWGQGVWDGRQAWALSCPGREWVPRAGGSFICGAKRQETSCHGRGLWLYVMVDSTVLTRAAVLCRGQRKSHEQWRWLEPYCLICSQLSQQIVNFSALTKFNCFTDFFWLCGRSLGLADFAESAGEMSVHHTVDVALEVSKDDTSRMLLHLHSPRAFCSVLHGSVVTENRDMTSYCWRGMSNYFLGGEYSLFIVRKHFKLIVKLNVMVSWRTVKYANIFTQTLLVECKI